MNIKKFFNWQSITAISLFVLSVTMGILGKFSEVFLIISYISLCLFLGFGAYIAYTIYLEKKSKHQAMKAQFILVLSSRIGEENVNLEGSDYSDKREKEFERKIAIYKWMGIILAVFALYVAYTIISLFF